MGDFQLADAAAGGGIIQDDAPYGGLGDAAMAFELDDVFEGVFAALPSHGAEGLVGGVRARREEREGST
jgi:hypothetical protein